MQSSKEIGLELQEIINAILRRNYSEDKTERIQQLHQLYKALSMIEAQMRVQMFKDCVLLGSSKTDG